MNIHALLTPLVLFGYLGQLLFSARFIIQWLASERAKRSIVPIAFWWFSLAGGITLFVYALIREGPGDQRRPGVWLAGLQPQSGAELSSYRPGP